MAAVNSIHFFPMGNAESPNIDQSSGFDNNGDEVFGNKIWWNLLRPIHGILYLLFAYNALNKNNNSWIYLMIDVIIGLIRFLIYHYKCNNFSKLF